MGKLVANWFLVLSFLINFSACGPESDSTAIDPASIGDPSGNGSLATISGNPGFTSGLYRNNSNLSDGAIVTFHAADLLSCRYEVSASFDTNLFEIQSSFQIYSSSGDSLSLSVNSDIRIADIMSYIPGKIECEFAVVNRFNHQVILQNRLGITALTDEVVASEGSNSESHPQLGALE